MNCNRIAAWYQTIEYATFGPLLWRARIRLLEQVEGSKRALVLGDGDGRFTAKLLRQNPELGVTYIEMSAQMLRLARKRAARVAADDRVSWQQADLRSGGWAGDFDLVVTHFVLDCLTRIEMEELAGRIAATAQPGAMWLLTEFGLPRAGWRRVAAQALLRVMYLFFRLTTGLKTKSLPDYQSALSAAGFRCLLCQESLAGFIRSELWQLGGPVLNRPKLSDRFLAGG